MQARCCPLPVRLMSPCGGLEGPLPPERAYVVVKPSPAKTPVKGVKDTAGRERCMVGREAMFKMDDAGLL